jgi:hypothetical protein
MAQSTRKPTVSLPGPSPDQGRRESLLRRLFIDKTDSTLIQLFRYTFVGGIAFLVDFGSLYALTEYARVHYLVSAAAETR